MGLCREGSASCLETCHRDLAELLQGERNASAIDDARSKGHSALFILRFCRSNLSLARDREPKHRKKSRRKPFSCRPTRPVAGEALNRLLGEKTEGSRPGQQQEFSCQEEQKKTHFYYRN